MPFRKSYTLVGVLDSGKSEEKVEVMTELAEQEVAEAWMRGGGGVFPLCTNARIVQRTEEQALFKQNSCEK